MDDASQPYAETLPRPGLRGHVARVWHFRSADESGYQPIVPDGCPELIIHLGDPYCELDSGEVQPPCLMAGQLTRPLLIASDGNVDVIGVRFHPDGAYDFTGQAMDELTNRRVALTELHGSDAEFLVRALRGAPDRSAQLAQIEAYVAARIGSAQPDATVRNVVDRIMRQEEWKLPANISRRQFQRRFRQRVGISARALTSVRRFRVIFDRIQEDTERTWSMRALAAGYFDQPQMARDFRRFLGVTARQWLTQPDGLAKALSDTLS